MFALCDSNGKAFQNISLQKIHSLFGCLKIQEIEWVQETTKYEISPCGGEEMLLNMDEKAFHSYLKGIYFFKYT